MDLFKLYLYSLGKPTTEANNLITTLRRKSPPLRRKRITNSLSRNIEKK
jgi:hypothetical protein